MAQLIEKRMSTDANGKPYELTIDNTRMRFRHPDGREAPMKKYVADELERRGQGKVLGVWKDGPPAPVERTKKDDERDAKLAKLREDLKEEQDKTSPNSNAIRALENQIAKLEEK